MVKRKDRLKELFTSEPAAKKQDADKGPSPSSVSEPTSTPAPETQMRKASGAVRAMGLSLGQIADTSTADIVELDANKIEDAMIRDRLSDGVDGDEDFASLVESIREHGQQVPILVRQHPDEAKKKAGFYQAAYGHRRIRACRELGQTVKALIGNLSDEGLLIAQGKENSERRNLSFIERAFFAKAMLDYGFERQSAQAALGVHKSEMSRLLQVAERIPVRFARAIGPAPKIGRPRWVALGDLFEREANIEIATDEVHSAPFKAASSDERFEKLFKRLSRKKKIVKPAMIAMSDGRPVATRKGKVMTLDKSVSDEFADYLAEKLPALLVEFEKEQS